MTFIYQFKITLTDIYPEIWRTIQVPEDYNFWDLHVAIQDAMGWLDCHLHTFYFVEKNTRNITRIEMPDEDAENDSLIDWEVPIKQFFTKVGVIGGYDYDFGDGWIHQVALEAILPRDNTQNYPICIAGERACPPEDCGGIPGFEEILATLAHGKASEKKEINQWLKNHAKNYYPFNPDEFNPSMVKFNDSEVRWANAFNQ